MLDLVSVPLVFTEYYEEDCNLNLQKVNWIFLLKERANYHMSVLPDQVDSLCEYELDIVVPPSANPFCSSLPARIPTGFAFRRFNRRNVVMSNDFICVVRVAKE